MRRSGRRITALPGALRRLSRSPRDEVATVLRATVAMPLVALALRRWGLRRVQQDLAARPGRRPAPTGGTQQAAVAVRVARCVDAAATHGPWPANCLQRSLVLWWFLRRRSLEGDLRIGVRRAPETGALEFHAWVEHGGVVINDRPELRSVYATFDQAIVPPEATFD